MSAALIAAAFLAPSACVESLCNGQVLAPFFDKLAAARGRSGRPVHILQIGDSHTAGDAITGAWRDQLQARYGSGGRGVLPAGRPYAGYLTHGVTVTMSDGWSVAATFGPNSTMVPRPALGLSGFSLTARSDGARIALAADPGEAFDRFTLCALNAPKAGTLTVRMGLDEKHIRLDSYSARPECTTMTAPEPVTAVEVIAEGGAATVTSWATFRDAGGVALSNVGVVGSQLVHFARTDDAVLAEELRAYKPDLIVVAFGTNEGFSPRFSPQEYEITLRTQVGRLRRLAGNVPILLLGAPDAGTRRPELRANAPGPAPTYCPTSGAPSPLTLPIVTPAQSASPLRDTLAGIMAAVRAEVGTTPDAAGLPPPVPVPTPPAAQPSQQSRGGALFPPAGLAAVRDVQRQVARSLNLAFWDWSMAMGGACTAPAWVRANPPLMRGDYVHYTSAGGREIAGRLQADLDRAAAAAAAR